MRRFGFFVYVAISAGFLAFVYVNYPRGFIECSHQIIEHADGNMTQEWVCR